ncbi:Lysosomal alpha-mannosidase [Phytophthora megakarya]|uniref:Lysosomal alpha-mannosidase n=1 Tax=Phytophthora megakarya TaxID=4795 RepID=A0A225WW01_9STRA|nr:Lysosomal alpha-mannosidase [Phytophthora megakarya]
MVPPLGVPACLHVPFKIGDWVTIEYRVNDAAEFMEIERPVGPVPIADNKSNEVIVRFDTGESIASDATLYTDSNGLEFMKRILNHGDTWNLTLHDNTKAVAANYFRSRLEGILRTQSTS